MPDFPRFEGYLHKNDKDKPLTKKKRYFVFADGVLSYYGDMGKSKKKGQVSFVDGEVITLVRTKRQKNGIELATKNKTSILSTDDAETANKWFGILSDTLRQCQAPATAAAKEGFLKKLGGVDMDRWQKRWFVIDDTHLRYYKNPQDKAQKGSIPLREATVAPWGKSTAFPDRPFVFDLNIPGRSFALDAGTQEELDGWTKAITAASKRLTDGSDFEDSSFLAGVTEAESRAGSTASMDSRSAASVSGTHPTTASPSSSLSAPSAPGNQRPVSAPPGKLNSPVAAAPAPKDRCTSVMWGMSSAPPSNMTSMASGGTWRMENSTMGAGSGMSANTSLGSGQLAPSIPEVNTTLEDKMEPFLLDGPDSTETEGPCKCCKGCTVM
eukprot:Rmarinus@m.16786